MANKLKTLVDLKRIEDDHMLLNIDEIERFSGYGGKRKDVEEAKDGSSFASFEELKREAIRWYHRSDGNKHKFILKFFNLTEKECRDALVSGGDE